MPDLLRHLHAIFISFTFHSHHHRRTWLLWLASTANVSPAIRGQLRRHNPRLMVSRSLQRSCPALRRLRHHWCTRLPRLRRLTSPRIRFPLRLSDRCSERIIQLHPASPWLAEQQLILDCSRGIGDRDEYLIWSARSDRWCVDLQG